MSTAIRKPTFMPLIASLAACLVSLIIFFFYKSGNPFIYIAYVCTPFVPIAGLAFARSVDIKGRTSIQFDIAKSEQIVKFCGFASIAGFLIALAVMYEIAMRFSTI